MTRGVTSSGVPWVSADEAIDELYAQARVHAFIQERAVQAMHDLLVWTFANGCTDLQKAHDRWFEIGFDQGVKGEWEAALYEGRPAYGGKL